MTKPPHKGRRRVIPTVTLPGIGAARRAAIAGIVTEDIETFAQARRSAQRGLVHALEQAETIAEIRQQHCRFALEAARDYALYAARFDALVDELSRQSAANEAAQRVP